MTDCSVPRLWPGRVGVILRTKDNFVVLMYDIELEDEEFGLRVPA